MLITDLERAFIERRNSEGRSLAELWNEERPQLLLLPAAPFEISEPRRRGEPRQGDPAAAYDASPARRESHCHWITALRAPQIQQLLQVGSLQLSLFDQRELAEISDPAYPGERLVACRNPLMAEERAQTQGTVGRDRAGP
jgi:hypothetical protein